MHSLLKKNFFALILYTSASEYVFFLFLIIRCCLSCYHVFEIIIDYRLKLQLQIYIRSCFSLDENRRMLRKCFPLLAGTGTTLSGGSKSSESGQHMNSQQKVLTINSPLSLLRMCYRSIDITVKSRHVRAFLKKELIKRWAEKKNETDHRKQRFNMDLAGSFLQALHTDKLPKPGAPVQFQLSRRVAYEKELEERSTKPARKVRRMPREGSRSG